jgi:hypothetical protein
MTTSNLKFNTLIEKLKVKSLDENTTEEEFSALLGEIYRCAMEPIEKYKAEKLEKSKERQKRAEALGFKPINKEEKHRRLDRLLKKVE